MSQHSKSPDHGKWPAPETLKIYPPQLEETSADSSTTQEPERPLPLPLAAFHGIAGKFVESIAPHSEADPMALLIQFLMVCGSILGRAAYAEVEGLRHHFNLFVLLVGTSSRARKGTSWGRILQIFKQVDPDWAAHRVKGGLVSGEGLIHEIRDPESLPPAASSKAGNRGKSKLQVDPGVTDKRLFCMEEEFASVLRSCERQGNNLSARIREAWDGRPLGGLTKNSPTRCQEPHFSVLGHITEFELRRTLNLLEIANGFGNRFLWFYVQRSRLLPHGSRFAPPPLLLQELQNALTFGKTAGLIERSAPADGLWEQAYPQLTDHKPGIHGALLSRAEAQVLRLSSLYAVLDQSRRVQDVHLQAALALWYYSENSVRRIFGFRTGDPIADRIFKKLQEKQSLTRTDISALFNRNENAERISEALERLAAEKLALVEKIQVHGRAQEFWRALR